MGGAGKSGGDQGGDPLGGKDAHRLEHAVIKLGWQPRGASSDLAARRHGSLTKARSGWRSRPDNSYQTRATCSDSASAVSNARNKSRTHQACQPNPSPYFRSTARSGEARSSLAI